MKSKLNSLVLLALAGTMPSAFAENVVVSFPGYSSSATIDYKNARPMSLPRPPQAPSSQLEALLEAASSPAQGTPGVAPGNSGDGQTSPVKIPASSFVPESDGGVSSQEYGTSKHVFTTNRTNANGTGAYATTRQYPFRAAGKLYFSDGTSTYVCSAALVKRGVVATAAHCVANYGKKQYYTNFKFYPALDNNVAPYGVATVKKVYVLSSYYNGTDSCAVAGVVCQNDVAVLLLNPRADGSYIGASTGWFGYGWNGYSYANNQALITQLGYPVALDKGLWQERTDSQGYKSTTYSNNTVIGSLQTGGSSGGPWVVNLGIKPVLSGISVGTAANRNVVVGTTSWGYTDSTVKQQGASPFTSSNIVPLVNSACTLVPAACS